MFNLPNLITAGNLVSGLLAIILTFSGYVHLAPIAIFTGAICDFFDGFAARFTKSSSELGKQLDSLADMVTFGVAPGMIMLVVILMNEQSIETNLYRGSSDLNAWVSSLISFKGIYI